MIQQYAEAASNSKGPAIFMQLFLWAEFVQYKVRAANYQYGDDFMYCTIITHYNAQGRNKTVFAREGK